MGNAITETRDASSRLSPATVALVLGLVLNAIAIAYSAGIVTARIDSIDRRLSRIETLIDQHPISLAR